MRRRGSAGGFGTSQTLSQELSHQASQGSALGSVDGGSSCFMWSDADEGLLERRTDAKPMFMLTRASETTLTALRPEGRPARKVWEPSPALSQSSSSLFRVKTITLPELKERQAGQTNYNSGLESVLEDVHAQVRAGARTAAAAAPADSPAAWVKPGTAPASPSAPQPKRRAKKYFDLLMGAHEARHKVYRDEDEAEARERAETAAMWANRKAIAADRRKAAEAAAAAERQRREAAAAEEEGSGASPSSSSSSTSSNSGDGEEPSEEMEAPDDLGPLVPYDGVMEVEVEFIVPRPPDSQQPSKSSSSGYPSKDSSGSRKGSHSSSKSSGIGAGDLAGMLGATGAGDLEGLFTSEDAGLNLYEDLEKLKEEMNEDDGKKSEESDDELPEGLRLKTQKNIWDNPKPRWTLGLGGTVFFVPDAERYAFGAALPPPPPPSLFGRKRLRLKPRLPLDISNHRYRDEHPNIWPEDPYTPQKQDYERFEGKLLTLDFYKGCTKALTQLPQAQKREDLRRQRKDFGRMVLEETSRSRAWKNFNHRELLKRKAAEAKAAEEAEARAKTERDAWIASMAGAVGP